MRSAGIVADVKIEHADNTSKSFKSCLAADINHAVVQVQRMLYGGRFLDFGWATTKNQNSVWVG
jgi:hypothetical protein